MFTENGITDFSFGHNRIEQDTKKADYVLISLGTYLTRIPEYNSNYDFVLADLLPHRWQEPKCQEKSN